MQTIFLLQCLWLNAHILHYTNPQDVQMYPKIIISLVYQENMINIYTNSVIFYENIWEDWEAAWTFEYNSMS